MRLHGAWPQALAKSCEHPEDCWIAFRLNVLLERAYLELFQSSSRRP